MTAAESNPDENEQNVYFMVKMMINMNINEMKGKKNKLYLIVCV